MIALCHPQSVATLILYQNSNSDSFFHTKKHLKQSGKINCMMIRQNQKMETKLPSTEIVTLSLCPVPKELLATHL